MRNTSRSDPQPRLQLTRARNDREWSQQYVAERIGTTHINVSRWERGITKPSPYFRRKLCLLFGKSEQDLDLEPVPKATTSEPATPIPVPYQPLYDPAIPLQPAIPLIGRGDELIQFKRRLCTGGSVALTALNGLPGVGKTALSIELAHDRDIRAHFRDGVLWAALGPTPNIPGVLSRWAKLLGVSSAEIESLSDNEARAIALRHAIGSRSVLLVIDDVWHVDDALALKVGGPNCAHLLSTRFPGIATTVAGEGATVIHELNEDQGMTLLKMLAPRVVDHEKQRAHDLVLAVGGLPLALTLVGNYLRVQAISGQPRRIDAALKRLSAAEERLQISELRGPLERHPSLSPTIPISLQSVFAVTDQQLSEQARAALYALSVFPPKPNSFSEEAAVVVAGCSPDILDLLFESGLLESSVPGRYTLHQTVADYARTHLKETTAHERLITYMADFVESHKKEYELLEVESNIVLAALEMSFTLRKWTELVRCACAFAPFLLVRGIYPMAELHLQRAYDAAMAIADTCSITTTLLYLGEVAQKQGNYAQAETHFQKGLALARRIGDGERISALLNELGWVSLKRGEYAQADAYLQEGLALARQIGDSERIGSLLEMLGSVAGNRGDYTQSEAYIEEGLVLARQVGDRARISSMLINLGVTAGMQGRHAQAEVYFQEGLLLARQIGHREWMSVLLTNLGGAADEQGNYAQAESYFQEGLDLAHQLGHREWISALLISLGSTTRKQGNYPQAEIYFQESLRLARQLGRPEITSTALYEYGTLYLNQRKIEAADAVFHEMLTIISEGDQDLIALARYGLARTAAAQGNIDEARRLGGLSLTALEAMEHRYSQEVRHWLNSIMSWSEVRGKE